MKKRIISMVLVVLLLCSMLSISALATGPSVTVYFTRGMFSAGGFDTNTYQPIKQHYNGGIPSANNEFSSILGLSIPPVEIADIPNMNAFYGNGTGLYSPNVLDAIAYVLTETHTQNPDDPTEVFTPVGGWDEDGDPEGGYISYFYPDGSTQYNGGTMYQAGNGAWYFHYTGWGWQIACTQLVNGIPTIKEVDEYATQYGLSDGMVIVFDYSYYDIYYPV